LTICHGLIWGSCFVILFAAILLIIYPNRYLVIAISVVVILLLCIFIIYDTQVIEMFKSG